MFAGKQMTDKQLAKTILLPFALIGLGIMTYLNWSESFGLAFIALGGIGCAALLVAGIIKYYRYRD